MSLRVGARDPVAEGAPLLPSTSIVGPGQQIRLCPRHLVALWVLTMPGRLCEGAESSWLPPPAVQFEGGPRQP